LNKFRPTPNRREEALGLSNYLIGKHQPAIGKNLKNCFPIPYFNNSFTFASYGTKKIKKIW
jgi:hypothetical protein